MAVPASELDKQGSTIRDMFSDVAPRYDLLNRLLSGALDLVWRRRAAAALAPRPDDEVLDLCCGTGDQALALERRGARVVAADFCLPMLAIARRKATPGGDPDAAAPSLRLAAADALALPFRGGRFAGATVAFGLRNVADLDGGLTELARVLRPGARLVVLEFALPERRWVRRPYLFYFRRLLPAIGSLVSRRGSAYAYLPASVMEFPQRQGFLDRMEAAGLTDLAWRDLAAGTVCLYSGRRPRARAVSAEGATSAEATGADATSAEATGAIATGAATSTGSAPATTATATGTSGR